MLIFLQWPHTLTAHNTKLTDFLKNYKLSVIISLTVLCFLGVGGQNITRYYLTMRGGLDKL